MGGRSGKLSVYKQKCWRFEDACSRSRRGRGKESSTRTFTGGLNRVKRRTLTARVAESDIDRWKANLSLSRSEVGVFGVHE